MSLATMLATLGSRGALEGTVAKAIVALTCDCNVEELVEPAAALHTKSCNNDALADH